jgi:beta-1,2-mannosidase
MSRHCSLLTAHRPPATAHWSLITACLLAILPFFPATAADVQRPLAPSPEWAFGPFVKLDKPVLSPTPDSTFDCPIEKQQVRWEQQNVYNPAAVVRGGKVYLLYRADDGPKPTAWGRTCRIGLAWSEDGRRFIRLGQPVLYPDHDSCQPYEWEGGCEDLHVVEDEAGTYFMNYTAWNGQRDALLVATSKDLIHWTKHGPAFGKLAPERAAGTRSGVVVTRREGDRLVATRINGKYLMFVSHTCALAESDNLIDWKPLGKAVWSGGKPGLFDSGSHEAGAMALEVPGGILLFYNAMNGGDPTLPPSAWTLGQALIDRRDLTGVHHRLDRPFLRPELAWEVKGFTAPAVVANGLVPFKGEWLLYYGAADRHIGLATCRADTPSPGSAGSAPRNLSVRVPPSGGPGAAWNESAVPPQPRKRGTPTDSSPVSRSERNTGLSTNFLVRPLPGHPAFVFTIYGVPGELESLQQLVQVMRDQQLGNGFDPGPTPRPNAKPIFDYLASVGWPVMCYPGCADMQVKGGRCVLGPADAAALAPMDRAGLFTAVQLGEWGYYFHNLSPNEPWWRDVYGKEFDAFKHLMKPAGLAGYDRRPASRQECYEVLKDYFTSRSRDLLGRVISVTGHSHYEAYAAEWGARCIGLEVGENIAFTQSKFAFARGASRQWQRPWSAQISPWFSGACTTSGSLRKEAGGARGLDAGHSLSLYERMWLHAWFAGAAMVTPENSLAIFFEKAAAPWTLTAHGRKAAEVFQFMRAHERGVPFTPVAIVLDHLAGYNGYMDKPWGILAPTAGDRQVRDLFDHQLFPGSDHIHHRPDPDNPESSYLRPTPCGEIFDVQLTSASVEMLSSYPVLLLAGDIEFDDQLIAKLDHALEHGCALLLAPAHQAALGSRFARLSSHPGLEVLQPWTNSVTGRPAAISDLRLRRLARETLPVEVSGDPIQYQVNRTTNGWVIELINNAGVAKKPDQPATRDPNAIARVMLRPGIRCSSAREWRSNRAYPRTDEIRLEVSPGQSAFVELICP